MKIPFRYNLRSLLVRWVGTLMTCMGIGLTVAVMVVMFAMVRGLDLTFTETGDEQHLIVIREGSMNEVNSYFGRELLDTIRFLDGVMRDEENEPIASGELVVVINHPRRDGKDSNLMVRGLSEMGFTLRPEVEIVEGRRFRDGLREMIVSRSVAERFVDLGVGKEAEISGAAWKVVGIFEAEGGAYDSEIWAGYQDISQVWQRPVYSSILLRAETVEEARKLSERISDDERIQLNALSQKEYYAGQTISSVALKALAVFIAVIMGIGSSFAIMNMMYGAVMSRQQEVATLRALGFRRRSILASFLFESATLAFFGGIVGCLLGSLFNGYSAGTSNFASFSEVMFNFRVTPGILLAAILFSVALGVIGGFLPARRAASIRLIDVLRR